MARKRKKEYERLEFYYIEIEEWSRRDDLDVVLTVDKGDGEWTGNVGVVTTILDGLDLDSS